MERAILPVEEGGDEQAPDAVPPTLRRLLEAVAAAPDLDARGLDRLLRRHPKQGRGLYTKRELLEAFRRAPQAWPLSEPELARRLRTCPTRSLSGVLPVTVFTKPFPCPGRCVFCPSDVRMPKSYLADEPGCQRAAANRFDPYLQTWSRLDAYRRMGHDTGKVELLVLGGTWSHHPDDYQRYFVARCLDALRDFGGGVDRRDEVRAAHPAGDVPALPPPAPAPEGRSTQSAYNRLVAARLRAAHGALLAPEERADAARVEAALRDNASGASRCVGLSVETRPDAVDAAELVRLRRLGVTKVQLGVQSLSDAVLARSRRGHDVATTRRAATGLRAAGFKLQVHWMPNLLGADPRSDRRDFARLFDDPALRPDELKIYPTSLLATAELVHHHASGAWRPYGTEELVELLTDALERVPPWCRVTRVVRDIPSPEILAGNRRTNLREVAEARLRARGVTLREIRAREVRGRDVDPRTLRLEELRYATAVGSERFLQWVTPEGALAGFLRLALPEGGAPLAELAGSAVVREVHVYGAATDVGARVSGRAQHAGLGQRLVRRAASLAAGAGYADLAVISAAGTRPWYRRLGFRDGALYQHLPLR